MRGKEKPPPTGFFSYKIGIVSWHRSVWWVMFGNLNVLVLSVLNFMKSIQKKPDYIHSGEADGQ